MKNTQIQPNWYKIDGKWVHYIKNTDGNFLDGKRLSIQETYEFEKRNFDILYPKNPKGFLHKVGDFLTKKR